MGKRSGYVRGRISADGLRDESKYEPQYVPAASDQSPQYVSAVSIADRRDICYLSDNILAAVCDIFCEKISEEYKR